MVLEEVAIYMGGIRVGERSTISVSHNVRLFIVKNLKTNYKDSKGKHREISSRPWDKQRFQDRTIKALVNK